VFLILEIITTHSKLLTGISLPESKKVLIEISSHWSLFVQVLIEKVTTFC